MLHLTVSSHRPLAFLKSTLSRLTTCSIKQFLDGDPIFEAADILLCLGPWVCSPHKLFLPSKFFSPSRQSWFLHPSSSCVLTFTGFGYANRSNLLINDKRTFTSQVFKPYRLLPYSYWIFNADHILVNCRISRFPRIEFLYMYRVFDHAESINISHYRCLWCCLPLVRTMSALCCIVFEAL